MAGTAFIIGARYARPIIDSLEKQPAGETSVPKDARLEEVADIGELDYDSMESRLYVSGVKRFCLPENADLAKHQRHISELPAEVLMRILKWTVSMDLDLRSLEQFGMVCSGFFLLSREAEIWRTACIRTWGPGVELHSAPLEPDMDSTEDDSWRDLYIERPRVHLNGVYISKISYIRHGESSFQDLTYRPWHLVVYYRHLRFFADGRILMYTSSEEPVNGITHLLSRTPRNPQLLVGMYQYGAKDTVSAVLKRIQDLPQPHYSGYRRKQYITPDAPDYTFNVALKIASTKRKRHAQLSWLTYEMVTQYRLGMPSRAAFDLTDQTFPPFYFSRVKSFITGSEQPLE